MEAQREIRDQPPSLQPDTAVQLCPEVLFKVLNDEAVLLDLSSGQYFGLNELGCRIWQLIPTHGRLGAIRDRLMEEYDVSADRVWRDLETLIAHLMRRGLVRAAPEPSP